MRWRRNVFLVHRWVGLVVSLQLLAWSVGGFMFTILDIDDVHGDLDRNKTTPPALRTDSVVLSPADALTSATADGVDCSTVARVSLRSRFDQTVYELFDDTGKPLAAVNAATGAVIRRISSEKAAAIALADFRPEATVTSTRLLEGEPPLEFRGGDMPVYQVILGHPKEPHVYIHPITGKILKTRNNQWRRFDFFWMLHIMDYRNREDFNHWLLTAASVLAIATSATGLALWGWRIPRRRRRPAGV